MPNYRPSSFVDVIFTFRGHQFAVVRKFEEWVVAWLSS
jgi:hypothetical protein